MRLEPNQAPYEGGWVFSSIGDTIRRPVLPPESPRIGRLGHAGRNLLNSAFSGATLVSQGIFSVLFPSDCRLCGAPLTNISRLPVCQDCISAMEPIPGATCEVCGERTGPGHAEGQKLCSPCRETRPYFSKAVAFGAYEGELRELIHLLKYQGIEPAARLLGSMLAEAIEKLNLSADSVLAIPVPLHRSKKHDRGFNQAELIARFALKQSLPHCAIGTNVLERSRPTVSQIGLTRPQRAENIRGAFRVTHLTRVTGRNILLVDDVMTTGTTANECARILLKAGAGRVWVATVARTLKESAGYSGVRQEAVDSTKANIASAS